MATRTTGTTGPTGYTKVLKAFKALKALKADGRQRLWRRRAVDANRLPAAVVARHKRCLFCVVGKDGGKRGRKKRAEAPQCVEPPPLLSNRIVERSVSQLQTISLSCR